jgi:hypothetical protein
VLEHLVLQAHVQNLGAAHGITCKAVQQGGGKALATDTLSTPTGTESGRPASDSTCSCIRTKL